MREFAGLDYLDMSVCIHIHRDDVWSSPPVPMTLTFGPHLLTLSRSLRLNRSTADWSDAMGMTWPGEGEGEGSGEG